MTLAVAAGSTLTPARGESARLTRRNPGRPTACFFLALLAVAFITRRLVVIDRVFWSLKVEGTFGAEAASGLFTFGQLALR